jgi:hypothetical protein
MTHEQICALGYLTDDGTPAGDLRATCRQLAEERATLLEAARYFLAGPAGEKKDRWTSGLRKAVAESEKEWKPVQPTPLAPGR